MDAEIKFCGMTRPEDARYAAVLGAAYVGVIFAGGPRQLTIERAAEVFTAASPAKRVGVFALQRGGEIGSAAEALGLDVAQLHHDACDASRVDEVRRHFRGEVWAVVRVGASGLPIGSAELFGTADAVLLDAMVPGRLGGSGVALPWSELAAEVARVRQGSRLVLAGGLRSENVAQAINALEPDVVDVSSGVEQSPGVKDHARMRAFSDAVRAAKGSR